MNAFRQESKSHDAPKKSWKLSTMKKEHPFLVENKSLILPWKKPYILQM